MLIPHTKQHPQTTDTDISSIKFWSQTFEERDAGFARLRRIAPVSWHAPLEVHDLTPDMHGEAGFWAITLADDIRYVSMHPELFTSTQSIAFNPTPFVGVPTFLTMDPPDNVEYRRIMSAGFTPKSVRHLTDKINQRAASIVDRVVGAGDIDFVHEVSAKLPMQTVADMIGVPDSLTEQFAELGNRLIGSRDPEILPEGMTTGDFMLEQAVALQTMGMELVRHRREHPADDILTALGTIEINGERLTDDQIGAHLVLLCAAGLDTTKQTTTLTLIAFDKNPDQREWLLGDYEGRIDQSVGEFIRHSSPVIAFARTATQDLQLGEARITQGDKVVMFYCSGNRDEKVFADPAQFRLNRLDNKHVGFGGGGVHYCLGNGIAKAQLKAMFHELLTKLPRIEVGEPEYLYNETIHGVKRLPVTIR